MFTISIPIWLVVIAGVLVVGAVGGIVLLGLLAKAMSDQR